MAGSNRFRSADSEREFALALEGARGIPILSISDGYGDEEYSIAAGSPLLEIAAWSPCPPFRVSNPADCLDIESSLHKIDDGVFRLQHLLRARRHTFLGRCTASLSLAGPLPAGGYRFIPHLHPEPDMVAPDQVFRSPCVILEGDKAAVALVPDLTALDTLNRSGIRTALTLEGSTISYGIVGHRVKGHVYFSARTFPGFALKRGREAVLSYYLFVTGGSGAEVHRRVNSFLWQSSGRTRMSEPGPQQLPLDEHARLAGNWAFLNEENWTELEIEGVRCGGAYTYNMNSTLPPLRRNKITNTAFILLPRLYAFVLRFGAAHVTNHPVLYRLLRKSLGSNPGASPSVIELQSWFSNVRSAYGAAWLAEEMDDGELRRRAALVREFALASPRPDGLFPAVLYLVGNRMVWRKGTRGFTITNDYHLADSCTTGYHLLEWYRDLGGEPAVLEACRRQADAVMDIQLPSGAFPAWFRFKRGKAAIDPCLGESAESAAAVMFLALLYNITGEERYLHGARSGGDFLIAGVVEPNIWYDYETFFSCSPKPVGWTDPRSGCLPENAMCMYWTAAAFLQLYLACGKEHYLEAGRRALDRLLAYHQVWDPPFLSINVFGGFASQNTDAEWNDARQGLIAPLLVDYYHATGEAELFERGIATLRACFTTMYLGREPYVPLRPSVLGGIEENYAHFGYNVPTPGYIMLDWGAGSSLYASARILARHGHVYLDLPAGNAFGIDGCMVSACERDGDALRLDITSQLPGPRELRVVCEGSDVPLRLVVNGSDLGVRDPDEMRGGITVLLD
ncbi:MAG: hypothetical protein JW854_15250 [Actinobacteria bacterium]|nr:hypothetical protein [Actinomycetota bacterium]